MIQQKALEKYMNISPEIAEEAGTEPEVALRVMEALEKRIVKNRRQPAPPPPAGGISLRAAERKYKILTPTISRWVKRGIIKPLLRTKNELYIAEKDIAAIAEKYRQSPGRGKREIINGFSRKVTV